MKKIILTLLIAALAAAFTACAACGDDDAPDRDDLSHELVRTRDLGGMEISITRMAGWPEECTDTFDPGELLAWMDDEVMDQLQALWDNRRAAEERYNFRVRYVSYGEIDFSDRAMGRIGFEDDFLDGLEEEIRAGNRDYTLWQLTPAQILPPNARGLFAPLPSELFDAREAAWNRCVWQWSMRGGNPHAFSPPPQQGTWPSGGGIFFNMRLLEEAGLQPDLPFNLQASGEWTWDALTEMARQIAAIPRMDYEIVPLAIMHSQDLTGQALISNSADFATLDPETGHFIDATNTPEFLQTIEWLVRMRDERLISAVSHEGSDGMWRDSWSVFAEEGAAMLATSFYFAPQLPHYDWGFVAFPKGPNAETHYTPSFRHPFYVIPYFFSPQEVDDIIFALRQWYRPLEGYGTQDWMAHATENHGEADLRSINETMVNFTENSELTRTLASTMMPWTSWEESFSYQWMEVWEWYERGEWQARYRDTRSAHEIMLEAQSSWNEFLQGINN
ncbi:MAG: extracellular solute-binding protein [Defluviitaleaceae bacterium]|nr:extracellular solute-binding protein [Defluviitaleaceae bacterium]